MSRMSVSVSVYDRHAEHRAVATHVLTSIVPDLDPLDRDDLSRFEGEGGASACMQDASNITDK